MTVDKEIRKVLAAADHPLILLEIKKGTGILEETVCKVLRKMAKNGDVKREYKTFAKYKSSIGGATFMIARKQFVYSLTQ